jgi:hypothetical protein
MLTGSGTKPRNLGPLVIRTPRKHTRAQFRRVFASDAALRFGERNKGICKAHSAFSL